MHILAKCSANVNNATVLRVAVRGSKRALGTNRTAFHFTKYTSHMAKCNISQKGTVYLKCNSELESKGKSESQESSD